jgi:hypothetical protein
MAPQNVKSSHISVSDQLPDAPPMGSDRGLPQCFQLIDIVNWKNRICFENGETLFHLKIFVPEISLITVFTLGRSSVMVLDF